MITTICFGGPTWTPVSSAFVTQFKGTSVAVPDPRMLEIARVSNEKLGGGEIHVIQPTFAAAAGYKEGERRRFHCNV